MQIVAQKSARGISIAFILMDIIGSIFGIASLALAEKVDWVESGSYCAVILADSLILGLYWRYDRGRKGTPPIEEMRLDGEDDRTSVRLGGLEGPPAAEGSDSHLHHT